MDIAALAAEIAEEEGLSLPNKEPGVRERIATQSLSAFARGVEALSLRNRQGKEWHEIAEILGFPSPASAYKSAQKAREKLAYETKDDLRFRQRQRLDGMFNALNKKITRGDNRSIEVAVKLLERESRLMGLDLEGAAQEASKQNILINIQPHPQDREAVKLVNERVSGLLPAPIEGVLLGKEVHPIDRGDGGGEDVVRTVLDSEATEGAE